MQGRGKETLVVLDFDGFLLDSYQLLRITFEQFGLDVGDVERFRHRRKFLKYIGGGREFLRNMVRYTLPKKRKVREALTEVYQEQGRIYEAFVPLLNNLIDDTRIHAGIISRNFTHSPGKTIRRVMQNSGVDDSLLDFVIPVAAGVKKDAILEGMKSSRYRTCVFGADEIGDYSAATAAEFDRIYMACYGFDKRERLINKGKIPYSDIYDTPQSIAAVMSELLNTID